MKVIILAGGKGERLAPLTQQIPKPMAPIGDKPLLAHLVAYFQSHDLNEIAIATGYLGHVIENYFSEGVFCLQTGLDTSTAARLAPFIEWTEEQPVLVTYGDGLCDIPLDRLIAFHRAHGKPATLTAVRPPSRFGELQLDGHRVLQFSEKPKQSQQWISGGFFIFEPHLFRELAKNSGPLEGEPLQDLATSGALMAYRHEGFWHPLDDRQDHLYLSTLWESGHAPWALASLSR